MVMLLVLLLLTICFLVYWFIRHRYSYFLRRSIPSPPISSLIYGHLFELWSADSYSEQLRTWSSQYGPVYGVFEGLRPVYVVSDLDFIQEVFVSQFTRFCARRRLFIHRILGDRQLNVFGSRIAEQWTRQRKILNPTYSISKMKQLLPTLQVCTDVFMEKLTLTIPTESINIQELYLRLAMDIICE
jgi:cytochrome P450